MSYIYTLNIKNIKKTVVCVQNICLLWLDDTTVENHWYRTLYSDPREKYIITHLPPKMWPAHIDLTILKSILNIDKNREKPHKKSKSKCFNDNILDRRKCIDNLYVNNNDVMILLLFKNCLKSFKVFNTFLCFILFIGSYK